MINSQLTRRDFGDGCTIMDKNGNERTRSMPLIHDFVILDDDQDPDDMYGSSAGVEVSDDIIQYILDSLQWIPCEWENGKEKCGLDYYGQSIIKGDNVMHLWSVVNGWVKLFQDAPREFTLKGCWLVYEECYEEIPVRRIDIISQLQRLKELCEEAAKERKTILHLGI